MSNTSLILRDGYYPPVHVLECDGPRGLARVNSTVRSFCDILSFEEYRALPEHDKNLPPTPEIIDFQIACRIVRLLESAIDRESISRKQIEEILQRMDVLFPKCVVLADDFARGSRSV